MSKLAKILGTQLCPQPPGQKRRSASGTQLGYSSRLSGVIPSSPAISWHGSLLGACRSHECHPQLSSCRKTTILTSLSFYLATKRFTDGMGRPIHYTSHSETVTPIFPATTHFNVATTKDFEEPRSEETRVGSFSRATRLSHWNKSKSLPGAEPRQNLSNFHDPKQIVNAGSNREKEKRSKDMLQARPLDCTLGAIYQIILNPLQRRGPAPMLPSLQPARLRAGKFHCPCRRFVSLIGTHIAHI